MAEAMIFDAIRTPRGRGKSSGALYDIKPVNLLAGALNARPPIATIWIPARSTTW